MTYCHVCSPDEWVCNLGVESGDTDELDSTIHQLTLRTEQLITYLETEESRVVAMMVPKYPLPTCPVGNPQTTKVATVAMINLAQKAYSHGLRT